MPITREQYEEFEARMVAPYGLKSISTKGRVYAEPEDPFRTAFQRDRDRILHTTAFRRLEYKTQVFVNYEGDYYRTRLTHTLEVAQIGRGLARTLAVNEDLVEGICLSHDLGHSPFGHAGEHILNELMRDHGGYDHNRQTYRIVTELEERYSGWKGLNLSFELLEGIAKHETEYDMSDSAGYDPSLRGTIEAQIANISDELAYNAHDLDDGLRAGLISVENLEHLEIWQLLKNALGLDGQRFDEVIRHQFHREMIHRQVADVVESTEERIRAAGVKSVEDVQRLSFSLVGHSDAYARMNKELKTFLYEKLYNHYRVARMSVKAQRFIREMFDGFVSEPRQLPADVQERIPTKGLHRAIADYIAGMTDRYALQEWQRLYDPFTRT